jgi:hypothetical protein
MLKTRGILALSLLTWSPVFGETAPWQQGTVVSVEQKFDQPSPNYRCTGTVQENGTVSSTCHPGPPIKYWEVTIRLENQVLVIRPYVMASGVVAFLRGVNHQDLKDYVLPPGVSAGITAEVAVFSNGTVTLQNGNGRNYGGDIVSQTLVPQQKAEAVRTAPTILAPPKNGDPIVIKKHEPEPERPTLQRSVTRATEDLSLQPKVLLLQNSGFLELEALEAHQQDANDSRIYSMPGRRATARTHSSRPAFLVPTDLARELELYQLEVTDDSRLMVFSVKNQQVAFPTAITIETVSDGVSRVSLSADLAPGEYVLSPKSSNNSFLFGID